MSVFFEKEFDDEVYEDEFYEEHFDEEELIDEEELEEDEPAEEVAGGEVDAPEDEEDWEGGKKRKVEVSYACEDCDYRWEDVVIKTRELDEEEEDRDVVCPMCGSTNITLI